MFTRTNVRKLAVLGSLVAVLGSAPSASAADGTTCSHGDATALLQTMPQAFSVSQLHDGPRFGETTADCQYRLFWDGETFTFSEDDTFLGGIVLIWDYKAFGITRRAAIADLDLFEVRSYLAPVVGGQVGDPVELDLTETGYKDTQHVFFGQIVWQQWGHVTQLAAGDYVNVTDIYYDGQWLETWSVSLEITAA